MTEVDEQVRGMVREALGRSREADPKVVGRRLWSKLSEEHKAQLAKYGLEHLAVEETRRQRDSHAEAVQETSSSSTSRRQGRSKWSVLGDRIYLSVAGAWKVTDECCFDDLMAYAQEQEQRGDALHAAATRVRELAAELEASGCATLGEMRLARKAAA